MVFEVCPTVAKEINTCFVAYPLVNIQKNYGKSLSLMGKSTKSMAMFNSKLFVYQRVNPVVIP